MKNITNLLENFREIPSAGCWDKIRMQLSAIVPNASVDGNTVGNAILQKSAAFWVKTAVISATTITAVTFTVISIMKSDNQLPASGNSPAFADVVVQDFETENPEIIVIEENNNQNDTKIESNHITLFSLTATPLIVENQDPVSVSSTVFLSSSSEESQNSISSQPQSVTKNDNNTSQNTSLVSQKNIVTPIEKDPVVQQYKESINTQPSNPVIIEIPNIITPNGDGYNDTFIILGIENLTQNRLTIWDKSRTNRVFTATSYQNNWGDNVEAGVYYYLFEYTINGIQEIKRGTITVLR